MICSQARSDSPSDSSAQYMPMGSALCMKTSWSSAPGATAANSSLPSGDHGDVLGQHRVGLGVGLRTHGLVGARGASRQRSVDVRKALAELGAGTRAEVVVEEVRGIGVVGVPAQQVEAREIPGIGV